jgi:hypothetical protein
VHERSVLTECNWFFWMNVLILLSESAKVADYALHSISADRMKEHSPVWWKMGAFQLWRFSLVIYGTTKQTTLFALWAQNYWTLRKHAFFFLPVSVILFLLISSQHTSCVTKFQLHCDWKTDIFQLNVFACKLKSALNK